MWRRVDVCVALTCSVWLSACRSPELDARAAHERVTTWATAPLVEETTEKTPGLPGAPLVQSVRVTAGGTALRLRLGNYFGESPQAIGGATVEGVEQTVAGSGREVKRLRFSVQERVTVAAGASVDSVPKMLTVHTASRSNSFLHAGKNSPRWIGTAKRSVEVRQ